MTEFCYQCGGSLHMIGAEMGCGTCGLPVSVGALMKADTEARDRRRAEAERIADAARETARQAVLPPVEKHRRK